MNPGSVSTQLETNHMQNGLSFHPFVHSFICSFFPSLRPSLPHSLFPSFSSSLLSFLHSLSPYSFLPNSLSVATLVTSLSLPPPPTSSHIPLSIPVTQLTRLIFPRHCSPRIPLGSRACTDRPESSYRIIYKFSLCH